MNESQIELLRIEMAAMKTVFVVLVRYFAEGDQLYIDEFCHDLDKACQANSDLDFQRHMMLITESIRSAGDRLNSSSLR